MNLYFRLLFNSLSGDRDLFLPLRNHPGGYICLLSGIIIQINIYS